MVWTDPNGNFVVRDQTTPVPDDLQFRLEDGTLATEGFGFSVVGAGGTMHRRYRPHSWAEGDFEGLVFFLVRGSDLCEYRCSLKWGKDAPNVTCEVLLRGLTPNDTDALPFDLEQSRRAYEEHVERTFRERERAKLAHSEAAVAEFEQSLPEPGNHCFGDQRRYSAQGGLAFSSNLSVQRWVPEEEIEWL